MTKYLVLYRAPGAAMAQMENATPEQAQAGMDAWMQWAGKAGPALIDLGSPLAPVTTVGKAGTESDQAIAGFSILEAESRDAVTKLLKDHPHFQMPGDASIEVLEYLPIPGM